jgi:hypothetical protein
MQSKRGNRWKNHFYHSANWLAKATEAKYIILRMLRRCNESIKDFLKLYLLE